jgi:hypothetical protein
MDRRTNMKKQVWTLIILVPFLFTAFIYSQPQQKPFGGDKDLSFAKQLFTNVKDYHNTVLKSDFYKGKPPHGKILRSYFTVAKVEGKYYPVIIKDNYGGEGADLNSVPQNPQKYLLSITMMVKREKGYDGDDQNWYWVKFNPDGSVSQNEKGTSMAGRVGKGMNTGCISCHTQAEGGDFFYGNDNK